MQIKTKSGRTLSLPSKEEDATINAGIAADQDTYEIPAKEFRQMKRVGRPPAAMTKERITIRLSHEVVAHFKEGGKGWQTRMDMALQDWLKTHAL